MHILLIPLIYGVVRFCFGQYLISFHTYGPEFFDLFFVFSVLVGFKYRPKLSFSLDPRKILHVLVTFIFGFLVYRTAGTLFLTIPFNLDDQLTLVFLLILGPILEELLFRQALWIAFERAFKEVWTTVLATTVFFAMGHFYSYFFVPPEYKLFIVYQTVYVFFLGLGLGYSYVRERSIGWNILLHMLFNFGFFMGSKIV